MENKTLQYLVIILIILVSLNIILSTSLVKEKKPETEKLERQIFSSNSTLVTMKLPALTDNGTGMTTTLIVESTRGTGRTLVDIDSLLFWADTQHSIRMARLVANNFSKNKIEDYNLIYRVKANASVIGGPSAGAAIAIATIFALNNEQPKSDVMITGAINHDGTIGPVSAILEKAKAAKQAGASVFLVPLLGSNEVQYETKNNCQKFGETEVCTEEQIPRRIDISREANITIIEVENIENAVQFFR